MTSVETHGIQPNLAGLVCEGLICEGYEFNGETVSGANVLYLATGNIWYRLVIDAGVVFWRTQEHMPQPWGVPNEGLRYPHEDVGLKFNLRGQRILAVTSSTKDRRVIVRFMLEDGRAFALENENDLSTFSVAS